MKKQNDLIKPTQIKEKAKGKYHNFDGHWKEMIQEFIQEFIEYFLPELYPNVDFNYAPEFLDTELQNILESIGTHKRVLDKLVKVRLKNGQYKWLLIHIEVQSYFEKLFELAMERNIDLDKISRLLIFVDGIMQLSKDLQEEYKTFVSQQLKFKETMVATSPNAELITEYFDKLKKRANQLAKQNDEQYIENIVATSPNAKIIMDFFDILKKEANRLAEQRVEKEIEQRVEHERSLLIHTLYFEKTWTIEQIAELLKIEKMAVQSVIDEHSQNQ